MNNLIQSDYVQIPWNKGKLVGQKSPLKLKEIWAIRIRLQLSNHIRDLALFNLAIDSKLRSCDLIKIRVMDIAHGMSLIALMEPRMFGLMEPLSGWFLAPQTGYIIGLFHPLFQLFFFVLFVKDCGNGPGAL